MTTTGYATGTFAIKHWDEQPYAEADGAPKLTHTAVTVAYEGDLEGEGTSRSVMTYGEGGSATYGGYERVTGTLGDRTGSFVLDARGAYTDGVATTVLSVVPGTGTGELAGLAGQGVIVAGSDPSTVSYQLAYRLA